MFTVTCPCGKEFEAKKRNAKFCTPTCRQRAHRNPSTASVVHLPAAANVPLPGIAAAARAELDRLGRTETHLGQLALFAAERLERSQSDTPNGIAALMKAYREAMTEAVANAEVADDPIAAARKRVFQLVSGGDAQ